jgi:GTP-binding protein
VGERSNTAAYETYLRAHLRGLSFAPITFISSTMGLNLEPTLKLAAELYDQAGQRVSTGELNRVIRRAYEKRKPRAEGGHMGKIYYASQVSTYPPTIVVFVNSPGGFEEAWRRFLIHELQAHLPFSEVPIHVRLSARGRASDESDG